MIAKKKSWVVIKMSHHSLPTQDSDSSDSGIIDTYVIRITPHDKFTFEQVAQYIRDEPMFYKFVIGQETVPRVHFHIVVQVDPTFTEDDVRGTVKAFLIPYWQTEHMKLPKGFGNKQYNLQLSNDVDSAVKYALKEKDYVFEGFDPDYISAMADQSFTKKKTSNFKSEYRDLCESYQSSDMDIREFMILLCNLKAKYDQMINMNHIHGYALTQQVKREGNASDLVENYLYNH